MSRLLAVNVVCGGVIAGALGLALLPTNGQSPVAGIALLAVAAAAIAVGGVAARRQPTAPAREEEFRIRLALGVMLLIFGTVGRVLTPVDPVGALIAVGGVGLIVAAVVIYRRTRPKAATVDQPRDGG